MAKNRTRILTNRDWKNHPVYCDPSLKYYEAIEIDEDNRFHFIAEDINGRFDWIVGLEWVKETFKQAGREYKPPEKPG